MRLQAHALLMFFGFAVAIGITRSASGQLFSDDVGSLKSVSILTQLTEQSKATVKIGGVTAKLRGATLDKCLYACIPPDNEAAFTDMALIYGNSGIYDIQVFAISTVQDAEAVARKDRSPQMIAAMKLFADLQAQLDKDEKATLKEPETVATLKHILELAPNHLSAKHVLTMCDGTAPKVLSSSATIYQLAAAFYPYRKILNDQLPLTRDTLPAHVTLLARKRLNTLRPIASKELQPLLVDELAMMEAMDSFANNQRSYDALLERYRALQARFATIYSDPNFMEKLVHEGY